MFFACVVVRIIIYSKVHVRYVYFYMSSARELHLSDQLLLVCVTNFISCLNLKELPEVTSVVHLVGLG